MASFLSSGRMTHGLVRSSHRSITKSSVRHFQAADHLALDYQASGANVWIFCSQYHQQFQTVNHGQGFPNWNSPDFVKQALVDAVSNNYNQYCIPSGHPLLVDALCEIYSTAFKRDISAKNIQTTIGACGGIENCCSAILNPGDKVVTFEPYFDFYKSQTAHYGADILTVPMHLVQSSDDQQHQHQQWHLDLDALERTLQDHRGGIKAIILNTPHNPTGYVTDEQTMGRVVQILSQYPEVIVISDEVYEDIIFDGRKHVHIAAYAGMFERTLTVNSAAKKFSCTGWKTGWVVGPPDMIEAVNFVSRAENWCQPTPLQVAVGSMLKEANKAYDGYDTYYDWLKQMYHHKRDQILHVCEAGGLSPITPQGSFFCVADAKHLMERLVEQGELADDSEFDSRNSLTWMDWKLSKYLAMNAGITCLPMSAFLSGDFKDRYRYMRLSFCATDDAFQRSLQGMTDMSKKVKGI